MGNFNDTNIPYVLLTVVVCLQAQVGTQLIRGISGGERKRTNIGMELIIDPSVLFLDEPTTGLDASTAHSVLLLLKRCIHTAPNSSLCLSFHIKSPAMPFVS